MSKLFNSFFISSIIILASACESYLPNQAKALSISESSFRVQNYIATFENKEIFLNPDGKSKSEWLVRITDESGRAISGVPITFYVMPANPSPIWRDVDELSMKYGSTNQKLKDQVRNGTIKLVGTVSPQNVITDSFGEARTVYTSSNIGSNTEDTGKEILVASYGDFTIDKVINLGYKELVPIPKIEGSLVISEATGVYVHRTVADILVSLAQRVKSLNWKYPLTITAGNLRWGGLYPPHFSHRSGFEVDIRPMSKDGKPTWCDTNGKFYPNYDRDMMIELVKLLKETNPKEMYFNDPKIYEYGTKPLSGHHHHIHVSWDLSGKIVPYEN